MDDLKEEAAKKSTSGKETAAETAHVEKKAAEKTTAKKDAPKKTTSKKSAAKIITKKTPPVLIIESLFGSQIDAEDILHRLPADAEEVYVKPDENKAYWTGNDE